MFAVLIILLLHAARLHRSSEQWTSQYTWWWVAMAVLYGGLTEIYQHMALADRFADPYDFIANTLGVIVGVWMYNRYASVIYRRWFNKKTF